MDELMKEMWENWKPYNQADDGKWRSYIVSSSEAGVLDTEADCVTLVKSDSGIYLA